MISVHNDGKESSYSFEASIDVNGAYAYAHGNTKEEAIANLKAEVETLIKKLGEVNFEESQMIDALGRPLASGAV